MLGEIGDLEFVVAERLGLSLGQVHDLPNAELEDWRAFYEYRAAMRDLEARRGG
jgi:hypothetical protein